MRRPTAEAISRVARVGGPLLALAAVALALGTVDAGTDRAGARATVATGAMVVSTDARGDAVLRAGGMAPGGTATGTVTVGNVGDAAGAFSLAQSDVLDVPGPGGGRLSTKLTLEIEDAGTRRRIYRGRLGAMDPKPLGFVRAGEEQTYRFTVTFPHEEAGEAYAGSKVETTFDWTAVTRDPPATPARPAETRPPRLTVAAPRSQRLRGRTVRVSLTCDEACSIAGLSRGARPASRLRLLPGRPAFLEVKLSENDARRLDRRRPASLPLAITVADRAGNRTTAGVAVRVEP